MRFKTKRLLIELVDIRRSKLYVLSHFQVVYKDLFNVHSKMDQNTTHLQYVMDWLKYAQDISQDGGVSAGYSFNEGWLRSYPETTGYIIPTFLNYYRLTDEEEYLNRAIKMANWLMSIQLRDGSFYGLWSDTPKPVVFDTGQVLQGLISIYKETMKRKHLEAACKAANWLVEVQDKDGAWRRIASNEVAHVFHTRVAWPLLELYEVTSSEIYGRAARNNIEWTLHNQETNGWFRNNWMGNIESNPYLHPIAYAIEGLLECGALMQDNIWLEAAIKPAEVLMKKFEIRGTLSGVYNDKWKGMVKYRCITGEAQMSVCWLKLFWLTDDERYLNAASKMNDALRKLQNMDSRNPGIRGGIKGSHPVFGGYQPFMYPNWAVKFFADALMLEEKFLKEAYGGNKNVHTIQ